MSFLPEISNRAGEQAEKLPQFPIVLSEKFARMKWISAQLGGGAEAPYAYECVSLVSAFAPACYKIH